MLDKILSFIGSFLSKVKTQTVLYTNNNPSTTSTTALSLSDNPINYNYLKVFYKTSDGFYGENDILPNGSWNQLFFSHVGSDKTSYYRRVLVATENNKLVFTRPGTSYMLPNGSGASNNTMGLGITRIVGIKIGGGITKVGIAMLSALEGWWEHVRQDTFVHRRIIVSADKGAICKRYNCENAWCKHIINGSNNHRIHVRLLDMRIYTGMGRLGISRNSQQQDDKFLAGSGKLCKWHERKYKSLGVICERPARLIFDWGCASC